jgi:hypothetical protein
MNIVNKYLKLIKKNNKFKYFYEKNNSYSGKKVLNCIIQGTKLFCNKNKNYLEIGVFKGHTIINNAINNTKIKCFGVDNFSLFNTKNKNYSHIKNNLKIFNIKNVKIIKKDFEAATKIIKKKIGVLFIDAAHDYRSQLITLIKYKNYLSEKSLIIIDDCNYYHVRKATQDFLETNKEFKLIFQKYTKRHIANEQFNKNTHLNGYWNGINILCKDNKNIIDERVKMPKNENLIKNIFFQSHEVFRHFYGYNAHEILDLIYEYKNLDMPKNIFLKKIRMLTVPKKLKKIIKYRSQNIF